MEDVSVSIINVSNNYYGTIQFSPISNILIWGKHTFNKGGIAYYTTPDLKPTLKDEIRIEYEPGDLGIFIESCDRKIHRGYPIQTFQNIHFEWSVPWSRSFGTKFTANYRLDRDEWGCADTQGSEAKTYLETLFRFGTKSFIMLNLGAAKQKDYLNGIEHLVTPALGLKLNLLQFLYVQFDWESTFTLESSLTHMVSTKITVQF